MPRKSLELICHLSWQNKSTVELGQIERSTEESKVPKVWLFVDSGSQVCVDESGVICNSVLFACNCSEKLDGVHIGARARRP